MDEKRRYKRFYIEGMDVNARTLFSTRVDVIDVSLGGASISTLQMIDVGDRYTFNFADEGRVVSIDGVVVWKKTSGTSVDSHDDDIPVYTAGIKFTEGLSDKVSSVMAFIDENIHIKENRLSGLRFKVSDDSEAQLSRQLTFVVKGLNLGGMLIEADQRFEVESRHPMELSFPEETGSVSFQGRIASCVELVGKSPGRYDIGVEFFDVSDIDKEKLRKFIRYLNNLQWPDKGLTGPD